LNSTPISPGCNPAASPSAGSQRFQPHLSGQADNASPIGLKSHPDVVRLKLKRTAISKFAVPTTLPSAITS
jgi:hypothetical protein